MRMWTIRSGVLRLGKPPPGCSFSISQPFTSGHVGASIQRFPNEILYLILSHSLEDFPEYFDCLNGETHEHTGPYLRYLALLSTVCRSWNAVVQPMLFSHLDPKSYKELYFLVRLLETNAILASYVRKVTSPSLKGASPHPNRSPTWRALPFYQFEDGIVYMISEDNYHAILDLFQRIADCCPNLEATNTAYFHTPTPLATDIQISPKSYSKLQDGSFSRIRELSLTRIILPYRNNPSVDPSQLQKRILLPELLTINSYDFPPVFLSHLRNTFEMPKLRRLKLLHGACRLRDLANILLDARSTMKDVYLDGRIVKGIQTEDEEDIPTSGLPWYKVLSDRDDILGNLEVLRLRGARFPGLPGREGFNLSPMRSLRRLHLRIYSKRSSFVELRAQIPTLEEIHIHCTFHYALREASFEMFTGFADILSSRRNAIEYPMPHLKLIRIKWLIPRTLPERDLWRAMVYGLQGMCKNRRVKLNCQANLISDGPTADVMEMKLDENSWRQPDIWGTLDRALTRWW